MTQEEIRSKCQELIAKTMRFPPRIPTKDLDEAGRIYGELHELQSQCSHPEKVERQVFPKPDCKQEECADCGEIFKECECLLCGATRELYDPPRGQ